ncbi:GntR family transcriptional regulator [Lachnotalea sp. AF33-28]|nr:GntR family transcriptional regulator [Lachnotalea sp. AF33-28]
MTMNQDNRELADLMRKEFAGLQTDRLIKIESERRLEQRFCAGRQRIREVIGQLVSEGLLIKYEGKGTYIAPIVKNKYMNLICSPDIKFSDPFYNRLLMELTNYAAKNSVNMIPLTLETLKNGDMISPVLMIGKFEEPDLEKIKDAYPRIISFENYPNQDEFAQIYFDHFRIGLNAAKVLDSYGHKRVIHITGPDKYASALYRKNGFIRSARKNGMELTVLESKMNFMGGYELAEQVERLARAEGYTAVFAANDWMAIGLIQAMKAHGVEVPDQISVLSVDNIPLAGQFSPALTTYCLDANMMIAECFSLMDRAAQSPAEEGFHKRVILQPALIARDTLRRLE